jgi:hypothetical protein
MFILKQAGQSRIRSYHVGKIKTNEVEYNFVKAGELNINTTIKCGCSSLVFIH